MLLVGPKDKPIAPDSDIAAAIRAAHASTKGKIVFVTTQLGSDNAEALSDFFGLKSDAKDVQVRYSQKRTPPQPSLSLYTSKVHQLQCSSSCKLLPEHDRWWRSTWTTTRSTS